MKCQKKSSRDFFQLFKLLDCQGCEKFKKDESIVIGTKVIHIYYINNGCDEFALVDEVIYFKIKLRLLLSDFCNNQNDNIFLWFDNLKPLEEYETVFSILFKMCREIHIINW